MKYSLFLNLDLSDINKHIGMWFHYLKYDKNKVKYKEILKKVEEESKNKDLIKNNKINHLMTVITLVVNRTYFSEDQTGKREIIKNIISLLSLLISISSFL